MAKVTVTPENDAEAATLTECQARFGATVVTDLVTNWLAERAEFFRRETVDLILSAAKADSAIQGAVDSLQIQATASLKDAVDKAAADAVIAIDH